VSSSRDFEVLDITDTETFGRLPPCADPRFDHRSCNYWEDDVRGSKAARSSWWQVSAPAPEPRSRPRSDNPFGPAKRVEESFNPFADGATDDDADFNPFAPQAETDDSSLDSASPRKLRLLTRGRVVFGSYAKLLLHADEVAAYAQFGPLSAYPRAQHIRELYPRLPSSPLPAVITCVATTTAARGQDFGQALVEAITEDLAGRGFAAVEAYPDLTLGVDESSAATPGFWEACGFVLAAPDERFPVMRRVLE